MQILGLEYKYWAVWICKYTEEDFTSKGSIIINIIIIIIIIHHYFEMISLGRQKKNLFSQDVFIKDDKISSHNIGFLCI